METIRSLFSWLIPRTADTTRSSPSVTSEEKFENYCLGGYYPVHLGELFNNRYQIISKLGYGVHSTVWLAKDMMWVFAWFKIVIWAAPNHAAMLCWKFWLPIHLKPKTGVRTWHPQAHKSNWSQPSRLHTCCPLAKQFCSWRTELEPFVSCSRAHGAERFRFATTVSE